MSLNRTPIEWVKNPDGSPGYSWNPITGCLNGCTYCYARKLANTRLKERYLANDNLAPSQFGTLNPSASEIYNPFYPRFWPERLDELDYTAKMKHFTVGGASKVQPKGIFVCDMSDLFGIGIPEQWTRRVMDIIRTNHNHRFYLLTKQPQNLIKFSPFPDNVWLGVSATNEEQFASAIITLGGVEAKVKYLSLEPLLGGLILHDGEFQRQGISWVIIGAQTKPTIMPELEWVSEIVQACDKAGVAVFFKDSLKPLFKPLMRVPNISWWGNVFGLRQEFPNA